MTIPPRERFHLYLLIGQSNMAGRGTLPDTPPPPNPRILSLNKNHEWVIAKHPLHFDKPIAGVGLGISFAETMLAAGKDQDEVIGLIPSAVGGTPLQRWQKNGDLYAQALARTRIAMEKGTLHGILWHQGENDALAMDWAQSYGTRFAQMIRDLRADLGMGDIPFVAGKLGTFLDPQPEYRGAKLVNEAVAGVVREVPNTGWVSSDGLAHKGDALHFNSEALIEFGKRYARSMQLLSWR